MTLPDSVTDITELIATTLNQLTAGDWVISAIMIMLIGFAWRERRSYRIGPITHCGRKQPPNRSRSNERYL